MSDFDGLAPDHLPDWLVKLVNQSKGRDMSAYKILDEITKHTDVIRSDKYDRHHYKQMKDVAPDLHSMAIKRWEDDPTWFDIVQDAYLGLYKADPKTREDKEMKPNYKLNWATMSRASSMKDWEHLRTYTELDKWAATMATIEFGIKLGELFDELKELMDAQQQMNNTDQRVQELLERGAEGEIDDAEGFLDELEQALSDYEDASGELDQQLAQNSDNIRQGIRSATKDAKEQAANLEDMIEAFGTEPGSLTRMSAEARMELAQRIVQSQKLRELAEKVGRFVRLALGEQARKIVHGTDEVHDIVQGNDINRVIPSELMLLGHKKTRRLFYKRYAERELLEYELRGTERVARGAIICLIDSSGSMMGAKDTWARAIAIALLNIAAKQKRNFHAIIFSGPGDQLRFDFPKGVAKPSDVMDMAEAGFYGGTEVMEPINSAIDILEAQYTDAGSQKGDIVFISDGISAITDEWTDRFRNAKQDLAFRFYGCTIGFNSPLIDTLSDQVYSISELAHGTDTTEMFGLV